MRWYVSINGDKVLQYRQMENNSVYAGAPLNQWSSWATVPVVLEQVNGVTAQDTVDPTMESSLIDNPYANDKDCNDYNSRANVWTRKLMSLRMNIV
jgi:hypothetical protein